MFQEGNVCAGPTGGSGVIANPMMSSETVDRELRRVAKEERLLKLDRAQLLTHAVRLRIWVCFGRGSLAEYLEEIFGHTPKVARDHVRVALAIEAMPVLGERLASGEQSYTALRELTRVTTAETVEEWLAAARGMNVRQIEQLVAGRRIGDRPGDPRDPDLAIRRVTLELLASGDAKLRQARQIIAGEHDGFLDDNAFIEALCTAFLDGGEADQGRARHQIMTTVCEQCGEGWQDAAGRMIAIDPVDVERAECDAQRVGSDREPGRAMQDVAPRVRRFVWRRDHGKCCVPSCRASRNVDIHHIVHRADGGNHAAENLLLLCGGHHRALHERRLHITGSAPHVTIKYVDSPESGARVGTSGDGGATAREATAGGSDSRAPRGAAEAHERGRDHSGEEGSQATRILESRGSAVRRGAAAGIDLLEVEPLIRVPDECEPRQGPAGP